MTAAATIRRPRAVPARQRGAVLLAMLLLFVSGAAYLLLRDLNDGVRRADRQSQSMQALAQARDALIAYAATYPDRIATVPDMGPGHLPCPDTDGDGLAQANCSDPLTTIGRLPWRTLGLPDPVDGAAERPWYALSENYRYGPNRTQPLNSDTPGLLTLDGTGDVVAVLFAPGEPLAGQDTRDSAPEALANYLEDDNADNDRVFVSRAAGEFNDRVLAITRAELMAPVQARVLGEVARVLDGYRALYGAYPWPSPFSDPKLAEPVVAGSAGAGSAGLTLRDPAADFLVDEVRFGDVVYNVSDGSRGTVATVAADVLTAVDLSGGDDDTFAEDDRYVVRARDAAAAMRGTAGAGSAGSTLADQAGRSFAARGVAPGMIVEIGPAIGGAAALVETVSGASLSAGAGIVFAPGQAYRIRSNTGFAGAGSDADTLVDLDRDFGTLSPALGNLVENVTDGSVARVIAGAANTLSTAGLRHGANDVFDDSVPDGYRLPRYDALPLAGVQPVIEGLLPVHGAGESFATAFTLEWDIREADGAGVVPAASALFPAYETFLREFLQSSAVSGALEVAEDDGACVWLDAATAECRASVSAGFIEGTAGPGSAGDTLVVEADRDLVNDWGVEIGDVVRNLDDGNAGVVGALAGNTVTVVKVNPGLDMEFGPGDRYAINVATFSARATVFSVFTAGGITRIQYTGPEIINSNGFADDSVVINLVDGSTAQYIPPPFVIGPGLHEFQIAQIEGPGDLNFEPGEDFEFRKDFVEQRRYDLRLRFRGDVRTHADSGEKRRDVCRGYGADCQAAPAAVELAAQIEPTVTITDRDGAGNVLGNGSLTIPDLPGGAQGSIRVAGLRYDLTDDAGGDVPRWFTANRWHELVLLAYADGLKPGGGGNCVPGPLGDCLQLADGGLDALRALAVAAGRGLGAQDRTAAAVGDYYEEDNAMPGDGRFRREPAAPATPFNDRVRVLDPAPWP